MTLCLLLESTSLHDEDYQGQSSYKECDSVVSVIVYSEKWAVIPRCSSGVSQLFSSVLAHFCPNPQILHLFQHQLMPSLEKKKGMAAISIQHAAHGIFVVYIVVWSIGYCLQCCEFTSLACQSTEGSKEACSCHSTVKPVILDAENYGHLHRADVWSRSWIFPQWVSWFSPWKLQIPTYSIFWMNIHWPNLITYMQFFPHKADSDGQLIAKVLVCARFRWASVSINSIRFHTGEVWVQEEDAVSRSWKLIAFTFHLHCGTFFLALSLRWLDRATSRQPYLSKSWFVTINCTFFN